MKNITRNVSIAAISTLSLFLALPSYAVTTVEIEGDNPAGGAVWQIDGYGIANAGDYDGNYTTTYYPNWIDPGWDIEWCGTNDGTDVTVTQESNGDVTVDCDENVDAFDTGVSTTMHFRFYAESDTGYLARQWIEITNSTDSAVDISTSLHLYYYWNYYGWSDGDNWLTSQGGDSGADGDTWGAGNDVAGVEIATTSAWAASCSTQTFTTNSGYDYPDSLSSIDANSTVNLVTYFNMNFPTENNEAGAAAAFDVAIQQASEYDHFTGRLTDGLPSGTEFFGWNDGSCPELLAETGAPDATTNTAGIAAAAVALGIIAVAVRRRRSS